MLRVATWNVNGIRARFDDLTAWAERDAPSIVCLQELKATAVQVPEPLTGMPAFYNQWHGGPGGYSGVSVHVRRDLAARAPRFEVPPFDEQHRIVTARLDDLLVASVYVHNGQKAIEPKLRFLDHLVAWAGERIAAGDRLLLCGDLNVAHHDRDLHPSHRTKGAVGQTAGERQRIDALLATGLVDCLRATVGDVDDVFTWWPPWRQEKQKNRGWRIDYVLASDALAPHLVSCEVLRDEGTSDHVPVVASFDVSF